MNMREQLGYRYPLVITGESGVRKLNLLMEKGWYLEGLNPGLGASPVFFVPLRAVLPLLNPEEVPVPDDADARKRRRPLMLLLTYGKRQLQRGDRPSRCRWILGFRDAGQVARGGGGWVVCGVFGAAQ
ncbi:MAG: hypothetical protein JWQ98_3251 [Chlorobi bacterium]|nr:hypothetical protein [Chlorobiota bacterium]